MQNIQENQFKKAYLSINLAQKTGEIKGTYF